MGTCKLLRVAPQYMLVSCHRRALADIAVGAREWLQMGLAHVRNCCLEGSLDIAEVGARERMSMGHAYLLVGVTKRSFECVAMGAS